MVACRDLVSNDACRNPTPRAKGDSSILLLLHQIPHFLSTVHVRLCSLHTDKTCLHVVPHRSILIWESRGRQKFCSASCSDGMENLQRTKYYCFLVRLINAFPYTCISIACPVQKPVVLGWPVCASDTDH